MNVSIIRHRTFTALCGATLLVALLENCACGDDVPPKHTVTGKVVDQLTGDPIVGARLRIFKPIFDRQRLKYVSGTETNSDGEYRFEVPIKGPSDLVIGVTNCDDYFFPRPPSGDRRYPEFIDSAPRLVRKDGLFRAEPIRLRKRMKVLIEVVNGFGEPVPDAEVTLPSESNEGPKMIAGRMLIINRKPVKDFASAATKTDGSGRAWIEPLHLNFESTIVQAKKTVNGEEYLATLKLDPAFVIKNAKLPTGKTLARLTLARYIQISGRIVGSVRDIVGIPVELQLMKDNTGGLTAKEVVDTGFTDHAGSYKFIASPGPEYRVVVGQKGGLTNLPSQVVPRDGQERKVVDIEWDENREE